MLASASFGADAEPIRINQPASYRLALKSRSKVLEVLTVRQVLEGTTGNPLYRVSFGEMVDVPSDGKQRHVRAKKMGLSTLVMFLPYGEALPYRPGSRWKLSLESNGNMTLTEQA